jgi:hypothetical protein
MPHKHLAVLLFAALALGVLLLFGLSGDVSATTIKLTYTSNYDCGGADDLEANATDNSCTAGTGHDLGVTADVETVFDIKVGHSNYGNTRTVLASPAFNIALDSAIPNGVYVGYLTTTATIALLNAPCVAPVPITIPFYDATTDTTDTIDWSGTGVNLTQDADNNGFADGVDKYPSFLNIMFSGQRPLARYYGYTNATSGSPPTQLNFVIFAPGVLQGTTNPGMPRPDQEINSSLGYINYVALNNPVLGSQTAPSSISDICSPLNTTTRLFGKTAGEGRAFAAVGNGELSSACRGAQIGVDDDADTVVDDGCMVVTDTCGNGVDNDGDVKVDEYCANVSTGLYAARARSTNPTSATSGVYGTGSHMAGAYLQSYRDADSDGIANEQDSCPFTADGRESGAACAPGNTADEDGDAAVNDGCPRIGTAENFPSPNQCTGSTDDDGDGLANDGCPPIQVDTNANGVGDACETPGNCTPADDDCDNDTFQNRQDNCPLVANLDQADQDSNQCDNATNDDGADESPTRVNDGCPTVGAAPETGTQCNNATNEDSDGINDGCPVSGAAESGAQCDNNTDDDADTLVNDGCPQVGAAAEAGANCSNATNDDGDGVNDGCPLRGGISESCVVSNGDWGPCNDNIGNACDTNPTAVDGDYDKDMPRVSVCIGATDTDSDGWCDATEDVLGPGGNAISDKTVLASVPEYTGLDYPMTSGAPGSCTDLAWYSTGTDPIGDGAAVDNDGDTAVNAADTNCAALALDTDQDGVPTASDNCPSAYNPDQLNSDTVAFGGGDALGDACDLNDDGDGLTDDKEWARGSDAKNPLSPFFLDLDGSTTISGGDSLALKAWINTAIGTLTLPSQVCLP